MNVHRMVCEGENLAEVLFVCTEDRCGRRVVVGKTQPKLVVIDGGEFGTRHVGSMGGAFTDGVAIGDVFVDDSEAA